MPIQLFSCRDRLPAQLFSSRGKEISKNFSVVGAQIFYFFFIFSAFLACENSVLILSSKKCLIYCYPEVFGVFVATQFLNMQNHADQKKKEENEWNMGNYFMSAEIISVEIY